MSNPEDPYKGVEPRELWEITLHGGVGGLRPFKDETRTTRENYWEMCKWALDRRLLGEHFAEKTVIELGCGSNVDFRDYSLEHGAARYTGVDLFHSTASQDDPRVQYAHEDFLRFLEKQPDESAIVGQFMAFRAEMLRRRKCERFGIDPIAVAAAIAHQVHRVVPPGEFLVSYCTDGLYTKQLLLAGFQQEESGDDIFFFKPV